MKVIIKFVNNRLVLTNNMNTTVANVSLKGINPTQFDILGVELLKTYHECSSEQAHASAARFKIHALDSVKRYVTFVTTQLKKKDIEIRPNTVEVVLSDTDYNFFKLYIAKLGINTVDTKSVVRPDLVYTMDSSVIRGVIHE